MAAIINYMQQSNGSRFQRWEGCWGGHTAGAECAEGCCVIDLVIKINRKKYRERDGASAVGGHRIMGGHDNQIKVDVDVERGLGEEILPGQRVWGCGVSLYWASNQTR